jgi:citronellol/citronellal dehydrogenase
MADLKNKKLLITGASRGIGRAIALRAAQDGAKVAVVAKTAREHSKLPGTIHKTVEDIEAAGGKGVAIQADLRDAEQIEGAVATAAAELGGIDIVVNNASALSLTNTRDTTLKVYDRIFDINARGSWYTTKCALEHLTKSDNPHVLNLAPPLDFRPEWFAGHAAYSLAKYSMGVWVLAMSAEFAEEGIAFNALWPKTTIATAAVRNLLGGEPMVQRSRHAEIVADAAHAILVRPARECTGNFYLDEGVLREEGVTDFTHYAVNPHAELFPDLYVE